MDAIGSTRWVIAEGYDPSGGSCGSRAFESHETFCIPNTGLNDRISATLFGDGAPVPAERTMHPRANDLEDPSRDIAYATVLEPNVSVVVQHSWPEAFALLCTIAYPAH